MYSTNWSYRVGGSLGFNHPTYIERKTDNDFYESLKAGHFCHVFSSRQMGKSSLALQVIQRLRNEGYACAFLSLDAIGTTENADEWYYTMIEYIAEELNLSYNIQTWWNEYSSITSIRRFKKFIDTVLLKEIENNIIIFIDEIDTTRRLKFNTDDFFIFVRACYNYRTTQPKYQRLTFAFFGVATPSELIKDQNSTPFNIGKTIYLEGFKLHEVEPLQQGLINKTIHPKLILKEILKWTGGQPFLTQKLCQLVAESTESIELYQESEFIEKLTKERIINNWENQDHPQHLRTISNYILNDEIKRASLLGLYQKILDKGEIIANNSPEQSELQLSGLVVNEDGKLKIYNKIYAQVFNLKWVDQQFKKIRPYSEAFSAWRASNKTDESRLLRGKALQDALKWSKDKILGREDNHFLIDSQNLQNQQKSTKLRWSFVVLFLTSMGLVAGLIGQPTVCRFDQKLILDKTQDNCFRFIMTSGEETLFISSTNFSLIKGTEAFKNSNYKDAKKFFEQAEDADPDDPIPSIFYANTLARLNSKDKNPLKLAVLVQIDYKERAKVILKGVKDAQYNFNRDGGKDGRLLEIVIVNEGNEDKIARNVARELVKQTDILGIIGPFSSQMSNASLCVYQNKQIPIIVPASTSSKLNQVKECENKQDNVFFRTIPSTKEAARLYTKKIEEFYQDNNLSFNDINNEIIVFYDPTSIYSETIKNDVVNDFNNHFNEKKLKDPFYCLELPENLDKHNCLNEDILLDLDEEISKIIKNKKVALLLSSVKTNSVAIAITKQNAKLPPEMQLQLFGSLALAEQPTLDNLAEQPISKKSNPKPSVGMIFVNPCRQAKKEYKQEQSDEKYDWRYQSSYDATQALIDGILSSPKTEENDDNNRQQILTNLESKRKEINSQYKQKKDNNERSISDKKYCLFQVIQSQNSEGELFFKPLEDPNTDDLAKESLD